MSLADALRAAFDAEDPRAKAEAALAAAAAAPSADLGPPPRDWPSRPGRPARPALVDPRRLPKRGPASPRGRVALLHALAHIELNAIDLAIDAVGRFGWSAVPKARRRDFAADWLAVAADEARHFLALADRLAALGAAYGDLPAHDGLWSLAQTTSDDLAARLALAPLVQEARGLDVTPGLAGKLRDAGDAASADLLDGIYRDEIGHVATGYRWFVEACADRGEDPGGAFAAILGRHGVTPRPPFNLDARRAAGMAQLLDSAAADLLVSDRLMSSRE